MLNHLGPAALIRRHSRLPRAAALAALCLIGAIMPAAPSRAAPMSGPTFTVQPSIPDPGAAGDNFGSSVALSGDGLTVLVGAPLAAASAGAAYVYTRSSASATFPVSPTITLPDPGASADQFGWSVALSGDGLTALIGAPATATSAGAAYIYTRPSASAPFPVSPTITLPDPGSNADEADAFGQAVALSGDGLTALVGAPGTADSNGDPAGVAYIYTRPSASAAFSASPTTTLPDPNPSNIFSGPYPFSFGQAVALADNGLTALISIATTDATSFSAGAAYVYTRPSAGAAFPARPTTALPDNGTGADQFGQAVALSGDGLTALVGAPGTTNSAMNSAGAAYVYTRPSAGAAFPARPTTALPDNGTGADQFGQAVALSGDGLTALVGAPGTTNSAGAAYTYTRSGALGAFGTSPATTLPDPGTGADQFGWSAALSSDGHTALVGAPQTRHGAGAAYTFESGASSPAPNSAILSFPAGWSLIALPLSPAAQFRAGDLLSGVLGQTGGKLAALYGLSGGAWGTPAIDSNGTITGGGFALQPGQGYLLYSDTAGSLTLTGTAPPSAPTWAIGAGWNLIGLPYGAGTPDAAGVLAQLLGATQGHLAALYSLSGGAWGAPVIDTNGTIDGTPFALQPGQAYLLYSDTADPTFTLSG